MSNEFKVVTVRRDDLEEYMNDYHHNTPRSVCKACHTQWPCDIYRRLRDALNEN